MGAAPPPDRLGEIDPAALSGAQRQVYEKIAGGPRGPEGVQGPLLVWLRNPDLADRAQALGAYCRYGTALPDRLSELAILTSGAWWRAGFEWHVHAPIAVAAGLDPGIVDAIRRAETIAFVREDEAAVHRFVSELLESRSVSEETYRSSRAVLGETALVDLVGIAGYYGLIAMTINAFAVAIPGGAPDPFA
ncbi:MAG: 4-carboxymuconolactone decarboxylase [Sphingopyxis macrogoltabida]|uniref:4-carboxymuconolactone decarboxylase n=1 Tax=Sphingopyxis macrogoltabida TaxID=33050 RepID=A0A2W5MS65_SPHMC|nr:MAG: 4-carboxymuconolactone decarboxylase [Sphingopyxis macrogoltabida]